MTKAGFPTEVFKTYTFKSVGVLATLFGRTETADVELVKFETSWDAKGVMRWTFVWDVPVPEVDLKSVRDQIAGGISDGWGESVAQLWRFGPLCTIGDDGEWRLATSKEKRDLNALENGLHAVLLTTVGSKFSIVKR